jgi:hypothetical protein
VTPEVLPALIAMLKDEDGDVRKAAAEALEEIGPSGFLALIEALKRDSSAGSETDWDFLRDIEGLPPVLRTAMEDMAPEERSRVARLLPEEVRSEIYGDELAALRERIEESADIMARGFAMVLGLGKANGTSGGTASYGTVTMGSGGRGQSLRLAQSQELRLEPLDYDLIEVDGSSHPDEARAMLRSLGFIVPHEVGHMLQRRRGIDEPGISDSSVGPFERERVLYEANEVLIDGLALSIARRGHLDALPSGRRAEADREAAAIRAHLELARLALSRHVQGVTPLGVSTFARMIAVMQEMSLQKGIGEETAGGIRKHMHEWQDVILKGVGETSIVAFTKLVVAYRKIFRAARRIEI